MWLKFSNTQTKLITLLFIPFLLSACVGSVLTTGAELYYERYQVGKMLDDHHLVSSGNKILQHNRHILAHSRVILTAFNQDLIITGQVPNHAMKSFVNKILSPLKPNRRRLFNELQIGPKISHTTIIKDSWITSKLRAKMLVNSHINQKAFKVITENGVVYIVGDVKKEQAKIVIDIAKRLSGVKKVVRILKYYHYKA